MKRVTLLSLVLSMSASGAFAQEPAPSPVSNLVVGSRVRVTSSAGQSSVPGVVDGVEDGVVTLRTDGGGVIKIPMMSISRLDVSLGRKRNVLQGLAAGALAGVLISFTMPVDPDECYSGEPIFCSRGEAMVGGVIPLAGIGALVGTFIKRERWSRLAISPSVSTRAGVARLTVALRF